ncbi:MAG: hypothetical protein K1X53_04090 [Candidatus Sumerlaeaceae bacterium]|nr:hypothetical protein [Candidatus Sumerlaeaceae bacterium]
MNLEQWRICLCGLKDDQAVELGRSLYANIYLNKGKLGIFQTHDGQLLQFWQDRYDHAFFTSSNRARHSDWKDVVARERIERIWWILHVVEGRVPNTACWEAWSSSGRRFPPNRLYIAASYNYLVWLTPKYGGGFKFESAYSAHPNDIERYKKGSRKIWSQ